MNQNVEILPILGKYYIYILKPKYTYYWFHISFLLSSKDIY